MVEMLGGYDALERSAAPSTVQHCFLRISH